MTIEKINENQIRCTLTKEDLLARHLKISELAYGSDKVKELFIEICRKAFVEYNFEIDGIPLVIEAIPMSSESLVLLVTKVEDPEELDSRFSSFTMEPDESDPILSNAERVYADEVLNCMEHLNKLLGDPLASKVFSIPGQSEGSTVPGLKDLSRIYCFSSLEDIIRMSRDIHKFYTGQNTVYKNPATGLYYLVIYMSDNTPERFNKACNIISEYANNEHGGLADIEYFKEHFEVIVKDKAIDVLKNL